MSTQQQGKANMELRNEKLDFWVRNGLNVLFIGASGVGKTARVKQTF